MAPEPLILDLLGTRFAIESDNARWRDYLSILWEGFVAPPSAESMSIRIESRGGKDVLVLPDTDPLDFDEPSKLAEGLRYWLVETAVARATDVIPIHAASLARDGTGIVLVGASGAGKTTLTLGLADAGWSIGSDDVAALEPQTQLFLPFPKPLGVRSPGIWPRAQLERWDTPWPPRGNGPLLVPSQLFSRLETPFAVHRLFFIDYVPSEPAGLTHMTTAQAIVDLTDYVRSRSVETVSALARLCRATRPALMRYPSTDAAVALVGEAVADSEESGNPNSG